MKDCNGETSGNSRPLECLSTHVEQFQLRFTTKTTCNMRRNGLDQKPQIEELKIANQINNSRTIPTDVRSAES